MSVPQERRHQLWDLYKKKQDTATRESLILAYAPWVKFVAGRLAISLGGRVEIDELANYGIIGLIDAIERFDQKRGVKFETYAISRIRGAMLDGIRLMDWIPHHLRQKARQLEKTYARLEMERGRFATDQEVAGALGLSLPEFHNLLSEISCVSLVSLDETYTGENGSTMTPMLETIADQNSPDPLREAEYEELKEHLSRAIAKLPEKEKIVVSLYYYEGLTLKEISLVLSLSESRVSQLHTKAIFRLRGHLGRIKKSVLGE
jgi:RNA polymerase sigma factor for flagellar operon FliA